MPAVHLYCETFSTQSVLYLFSSQTSNDITYLMTLLIIIKKV